MGTVRLLHVSDLHASADKEIDQGRLVEEMFRDVGELHGDTPIDVAIVSGDLAHAGTPADLELARRMLLEPLGKRLSLPAERIILIPGNHDVNRKRIQRILEKGLRAELVSTGAVNTLMDSAEELESATSRLEEWFAFHKEFYDGCAAQPEPVAPLAFVHRLNVRGVPIGIAALNSAWRAHGGDEDRGRILVGERQARNALSRIEQDEIRVVVVHHPLSWLASFDSDQLRREVENLGALVLSGHEHLPDPTSESSTRGNAIYGRVGCLYQGTEYANGFSVIDVDTSARSVTVLMRTWWPKIGRFGEASDMAPNGRAEFDLVTGSSGVGSALAYSDVMSGLLEVVDEGAVLPPGGHGEARLLDQQLVPPRFWPIPYREIVAARQLKEAATPVPARPLESLAGETDLVLVSGEPESGVTTSLIWLIAKQFDSDLSRLPVFLRFDPRLDERWLDKALTKELQRIGHKSGRRNLPPLIVALDDVTAQDPRTLDRLAKYAKQHPSWKFVLGTHGDDHHAVRERLLANEVELESVFLGPLGRREVRQLVETATGNQDQALTKRILAVVVAERLPRSPLIIGALVFVLAESTEPVTLNESSLLNSYVALFLGINEAVDHENLGMDYRLREHLLGWFASVLTSRGATTISRVDAEREFGIYFEDRDMQMASPGLVLDSLIRRRMLVSSARGVGFRFPALLHLFKAKWMDEEDGQELLKTVMADPLGHSDAMRHAAGLARNSRVLLERVGQTLDDAIAAIGSTIQLNMFDSVSDRPGWSKSLPNPDHLARVPQPRPAPNDKELDERFDDFATERLDQDPDEETLPERVEDYDPEDRLFQATLLLAAVLKNSELVADRELKRELLKRAFQGWGLMDIVFAIREDRSDSLAERIEFLDSQAEKADGDSDSETLAATETVEAEQVEAVVEVVPPRDGLARMIETVLTLLMGSALVSELGSVHLETATREALDDDEFMADAVCAFFATLLYVELQFDQWPDRLRSLYERHHHNPMIETIGRGLAIIMYQASGTPLPAARKLEDLLVDIFMGKYQGAKGGNKGRVVQRVKDVRTRALRNHSTSIGGDTITDGIDNDDLGAAV